MTLFDGHLLERTFPPQRFHLVEGDSVLDREPRL